MLRKLIPGMAALLIGAQFASADILWSSRAGLASPGNFTDDVITPLVVGGGFLEDGTMTGGNGPHSLTGLNIGFYNKSPNVLSFDVLVDFYDNVNYDASFGSPINTTPVGSQYRLHVTNAPAGNDAGGNFVTFGESGLLTLTGGPLLFPDSTFGVSIRFVNPNTTVTNTNLFPLFHGFDDLDIPANGQPSVLIGSSKDSFGADVGGDGLFSGNDASDPPNGDVWSFGPAPFVGTYYLELQGSAVPEPASMGLLALAGAVVARRRR